MLSLIESIVERYPKPETQEEAVVLSYTMAHVQVGLSVGSHGELISSRVVTCRQGLVALLGFQEEIYHKLVLNTILRRFDAGELTVLTPRGPSVLGHGIEEASVGCVESNMGIIMKLITPCVNPTNQGRNLDPTNDAEQQPTLKFRTKNPSSMVVWKQFLTPSQTH